MGLGRLDGRLRYRLAQGYSRLYAADSSRSLGAVGYSGMHRIAVGHSMVCQVTAGHSRLQ